MLAEQAYYIIRDVGNDKSSRFENIKWWFTVPYFISPFFYKKLRIFGNHCMQSRHILSLLRNRVQMRCQRSEFFFYKQKKLTFYLKAFNNPLFGYQTTQKPAMKLNKHNITSSGSVKQWVNGDWNFSHKEYMSQPSKRKDKFVSQQCTN